MAAFDNAYEQDDDTILSGLESVGQNSPPEPQGSPPPGGALAAPAPAGDSSDAAFGEGEPTKGDTYYDLFQAADTKTQDDAVEEVEKSMGAMGSGIIAKTQELASNAMAQKDGKTLNLLLKWGWKPPEERPAFNPETDMVGETSEGALGKINVSDKSGAGGGALQEEVTVPEAGPVKEEKGPPVGLNDEQAKPKFDRKQMGGFLMELGFNILASNREDAGGALGDAYGKTTASRDARKRQGSADKLAADDRARTQRRQDEGDLHKRNAEERAQRKEKRDIQKAELDKLEQFKLEDGTVAYYGKSEGPVLDKNGEKIKLDSLSKKDRDKLTAGQTAIDVRHAQDRFDKRIAAIKEDISSFDEQLTEELGENPTDAEVGEYAMKQLDERDRILLGGKAPSKEDIQDYDTLDY